MNKFADVAIPEMLKALKSKGCNMERLKAKIAGGAQIFAGLKEKNIDIGQRNQMAVRLQLQINDISLVARDTGGCIGRTLRFDTRSCRLSIHTKEYDKDI